MSEERKKILNMLAEGKISVDDAERLLTAIKEGCNSSSEMPATRDKKAKFLRIIVEDKSEGANVNVRVPVSLLRAGMKLKSIMPEGSMGEVDAALKDKGINIDLLNANPEMMDELVKSLCDMTVDVNKDSGEESKSVRIFCE